MEDSLNVLLNQFFNTTNVNYIVGGDNIKQCLYLFHAKTEKTQALFPAFLYFFPLKSETEKNMNDFWFFKYKKDGTYTEYNFALDLLSIIIQNEKGINEKVFHDKFLECSMKFQNYKLFSTYYSAIKKYFDTTTAIVAYLTKDSSYYSETLNLEVLSSNIQTVQFIESVKREILNKHEIFALKGMITQMKNSMDKLIVENQENANSIKKLNIELTELKDVVKKQKVKLDQIFLRDTIKMCFKYLYKILFSKFGGENYTNNFWDELIYIKNILSKPEFKQFSFMNGFIEDIEFNQLSPLNTEAHDPNEKRRIEAISDYLQKSSNQDLTKVVSFFNSFPNIDEFINLNLIHYFSPKKADDKFEKNVKFADVYEKIFSQKIKG